MKYLSDHISLEVQEAGGLNFIKAFKSRGLVSGCKKSSFIKEHDFCAFGW